MTWALRSLCRPPPKSAFTHHRRWLVVVWPAAIVRPPGERGRDGSAIIFPLPVYTADANGGLCIGRSRADHRGLGAVGYQQAAPGIYRCIACRYYQHL